jgi:hypothetical protein
MYHQFVQSGMFGACEGGVLGHVKGVCWGMHKVPALRADAEVSA